MSTNNILPFGQRADEVGSSPPEVFTHRINATETTDAFLLRYERFMIGKLVNFTGKSVEEFSFDRTIEPFNKDNQRYYYFHDQQNKKYCVLVDCDESGDPKGYRVMEF